MNGLNLIDNLPLDTDLKSVKIGDVVAPIELSDEKVRVKNLDVIGDFNVAGQDDNLLDRVGTDTYVKNIGDNFGIGTATPDEELHVYGTIKMSTHADSLEFASPTTSKMAMGLYGNNDLLTKNANGDTLMTILNAGNVGIGTANPAAKLEIENADTGSDLIAVLIDNNDPENWALDVQNGAGAYGIRYASTNGTVNPMLSLTGDGGVFEVQHDGKVGIGTASPYGMLTLQAPTGVETALYLANYDSATSGSNAIIRFGNRAVDGETAYIGSQADGANDAGNLVFGTEPTGGALAERMRITSTGKVGIGVTDPDAELEILSTTTQQKWSYDADSFTTLAVADSSHTTLATGETGNFILDVAGDIELNADGGDVVIKDNTATLGTINITTAFIHYTETDIDAADMNDLHNTAITLVSAPGANKMILPLGFTLLVDRHSSTTQSSSTADLFISYDGVTTLGKTMGYIRRFMYNEGGDRTYMLSPDSYSAEVWDDNDVDNKPIQIKLDAAITADSIDGILVRTAYWVFG